MPRIRRLPTSSKWCFTLNNPEEDQKKDLFKEEEDKLIYAIWQLERAPTTDTYHIQGYVILKRHQDLNWIKRLISNEVHAEIARGSAEDNKKYCSKEASSLEGPWEFGEIPINQQGKRTDLMEVQNKLDAGSSMCDIAQQHFSSYVRYGRGFHGYLAETAPKRDFKTQVIVLIGPTDIGKSWWATHNTRNAFVVWDEKWFDGYNGRDDMIINDFTGWINFNKLLQILDEGPWTLQIKSGVIQCAPRRIVMTSNFLMETWYEYANIRGNFEALKRRCEYIFDVTEEATPHEHWFTDDWTLGADIICPYPAEDTVIDWDEPIELDRDDEQSTWDVEDAAYNLADLPSHEWNNDVDLEGQSDDIHSDFSNKERAAAKMQEFIAQDYLVISD